MSRANATMVAERLGYAATVFPAGWTTTTVNALCVRADYLVDAETYPRLISTTTNPAKELAVDVTLRLMKQADSMKRSSGVVSADGATYPDMVIFTSELKERLKRLLRSSTISGGMKAMDLMG